MDNSRYVVTFGEDNKPITVLNKALAKRQNISAEQLLALKFSHQIKHLIFEAATAISEEEHGQLQLKLLAALFDTLETEQQKLWNFPPNPDFHRWFDFPGCKCPKMDNVDLLGIPRNIIALDCPIHGYDTVLGEKVEIEDTPCCGENRR